MKRYDDVNIEDHFVLPSDLKLGLNFLGGNASAVWIFVGSGCLSGGFTVQPTKPRSIKKDKEDKPTIERCKAGSRSAEFEI